MSIYKHKNTDCSPKALTHIIVKNLFHMCVYVFLHVQVHVYVQVCVCIYVYVFLHL